MRRALVWIVLGLALGAIVCAATHARADALAPSGAMTLANSWMWWLLWWPLAIGSFGLIEHYALAHPDRQWTLSRTIAFLGARFPLTIGVFGAFFGGLMVHFFWHFCL
jgi:hypothetical protein